MFLDASQVALTWSLPFLGMLLSIGLGSGFFPNWWGKNFKWVSLGWALTTLVILGAGGSWEGAWWEALAVILSDYLPFIILISTLYLLASHVVLSLRGSPSPLWNTLFLGAGALIAGIVGTTGASMILVRPWAILGSQRKHATHLFVFFIFLVSNIGGILSTLGDPPLFEGFLHGISFWWPTQALWAPFLLISVPLLGVFYGADTWYQRREKRLGLSHPKGESTLSRPNIRLEGTRYLLGFLGITLILVGSSLAPLPPGKHQIIWGPLTLSLRSLIRDGLLGLLFLALWQGGSRELRQKNNFSWHPIQEVVFLFLGIFISGIPVFKLLAQGEKGPLAPLLNFLQHSSVGTLPWRYFWTTGGLSCFLDNVPTYLVFFLSTGFSGETLMTSQSLLLKALSTGAVFMGAVTYIGNAPNLMVKSIIQESHLPMPSFFGYLKWSLGVLLPIFWVFSWVYFG